MLDEGIIPYPGLTAGAISLAALRASNTKNHAALGGTPALPATFHPLRLTVDVIINVFAKEGVGHDSHF